MVVSKSLPVRSYIDLPPALLHSARNRVARYCHATYPEDQWRNEARTILKALGLLAYDDSSWDNPI